MQIDEYFRESIKCHHNDIAYYIENNYLSQKDGNLLMSNSMYLNICEYQNYPHFTPDFERYFDCLCFSGYKTLVKLLIKQNERKIEDDIKMN